MLICRHRNHLSQSLLFYTTRLTFNKQLRGIERPRKTYSEHTKQLSELNSDMIEILEPPDKKFNVTMTNMLKALMAMLDDIQIRKVILVEEL